MSVNGNNIPRFWLFGGVFAPVMMMVIIAVVGQITPDYKPVSDSICQMGTPDKPYAIVLNGGYVVYGILLGIAAGGLYRSLGSTSTARILTVLLCIHALGTMLLGFFPDSLDFAGKHSYDDFLHNTMSAISYLPLLGGILIFRKISKQEKALRVTGILGLFIVTANLPMPFINMFETLQPVSGLLQRLLAGASFSWLALTFLLLHNKCYRLSQESTSGCQITEIPGEERYPI